MKLKLLTTMLLAFCIPGLALAGYVQPAPVDITLNADGSGNATGDMVTARFADNEVEHIGCGVRIWKMADGSYLNWGFCQARDADEVNVFCSTEDPDLLDVMKATSSYSFITFAWDTDEECTRIGFSTQSFYLPEHTDKKKK